MDPFLAQVISTGVQATAGIGSNYFSGKAQEKANDSMLKYLKTLPAEYQKQLGVKLQEIQKLQPGVDLYQTMTKELQDYNKSFNPDQYKVDAPKEFEYAKSTDEFLNPYIDYRIKKVGESVDRSAANRGTLFSGGTGKELLERTSEVTDQDWESATTRRTSDRDFEYRKQREGYADIIANSNRNLDLWKTKGSMLATNIDAQGNSIDAQGNIIDKNLQAQGTFFDQTNTTNTDAAKINAINAGKGDTFWANILGGIAGVGASIPTINAAYNISQQPSYKPREFDASSIKSAYSPSTYAASGFRKFDPNSVTPDIVGGIQMSDSYYTAQPSTNLSSRNQPEMRVGTDLSKQYFPGER